MNALFYQRRTCRLCASKNLQLAVPLLPTPIGDKYLPLERAEETRDTIPLELYLCNACGHLQTAAVVNPERVYKHYLSRPAAVNPVLSEAYRRYAENILAAFGPAPGNLVVEIGSNDGRFLRFFKDHGMSVLGIDPAQNLADAATQAGIETIPDFFTLEIAKEIRKKRGSASVIIANFVYANIDDLEDVTIGVRELLSPNGVFVFETNYRVDVFDRHLIETINHEHLSYFSVKPLASFFEKHEMQLANVEHVPSKGGSIRCTVKLKEAQYDVSSSVEKHVLYENGFNTYKIEFYRPCVLHIEHVRNELEKIVGSLRWKGKTFAGYGTSIGATIIIYQLGLGTTLRFLVDDDLYRQNLVSPGYHIPVVSPQALSELNPDYVVILAPLYSEQIMARNKAYIETGGHFLEVWPGIRIHP